MINNKSEFKEENETLSSFVEEFRQILSKSKHQWNILAMNKKIKSVSYINKSIHSSQKIADMGFGIRIITNKGQRLISFNSIQDFDKIKRKIKEFIKRYENERIIKDYFIQENNDKKIIGKKSAIKEIENTELREMGKIINIEKDKEYKSYHALIQSELQFRLFVNSSSWIEQTFPRSVYVLKLYSKENEVMSKDAQMAGLKEINSEKVFNDAIHYIKDLNHAKSFKPAIYDAVINGSLTNVFIHEALGHASEIDLVMKNASILKNKIGRKIAQSNINVYDSPLGHNGEFQWGNYFYDDEGIKAQKTKIISEGVLNTYLISLNTYHKLKRLKDIKQKLMPTGNSRSQNYTHVPIVRMSNTYIEKGDYSKEELLEELKNGIYLVNSYGGQVNTVAGNFQFNALLGYVVKNGKILHSIRGASLQGDTLKVLNNIKAIGNRYEPTSAGTCGKEGQEVPVGGDSPSVLIKNAFIGLQ